MSSTTVSIAIPQALLETVLDKFSFPIEIDLLKTPHAAKSGVVGDWSEFLPKAMLYDLTRYRSLLKMTANFTFVPHETVTLVGKTTPVPGGYYNSVPTVPTMHGAVDTGFPEIEDYKNRLRDELAAEIPIARITTEIREGFADLMVCAYSKREQLKNNDCGISAEANQALVELLSEIKMGGIDLLSLGDNVILDQIKAELPALDVRLPITDKPTLSNLVFNDMIKRVVLDQLDVFSQMSQLDDEPDRSIFKKILKAICAIFSAFIRVTSTEIVHLVTRISRPNGVQIGNGSIQMSRIECRVDVTARIFYEIGNIGSFSLIRGKFDLSKSNIHCDLDVALTPYVKDNNLWLKPEVLRIDLIVSISVQGLTVNTPIGIKTLMASALTKVTKEMKLLSLRDIEFRVPFTNGKISVDTVAVLAENNGLVVQLGMS